MKDGRRIPRKRRSPGKTLKVGQRDVHTPSAWEARLCELELRLTQLGAENHRLREAHRQLETASASRAKLQDLAPVGLVTLDTRGTILAINQTGAALVGWDKKQLIERRFTFLVWPEDMKRFLDHLRRCRRESPRTVPQPRGNAHGGRHKLRILLPPHTQSIELRLRGAAAGPITVQLASVPLMDQRSRVVKLETTFIDITQRKEAEAALRVGEENLHALIEASPHPVQFKDANARWQMANQAALALFELTGVDYRNKNNAELADRAPSYRGVLAAQERRDRAALAAGLISRTDERIPKPDGATRILDVIRVPLLHDDGQPKGLVVLGYDFTERELAAEALRAREAELRLVTDVTPVMLTRCSRDLRYVFVNSTYAEFLGLTPRQILGKPIAAVIGEDALDTIRPYVERVLGGQSVEFEAEIPYPRRGRRFMDVAYTPDRDEHGNVVGWIEAINDITNRKETEETLRQSEDRFRTLASHAPVGIFMADAHGDAVYVNAICCDMAGLSHDQALGREWLKAVHPEDREYVTSGWDEAVKRRDIASAEFRFLRSDGVVTWVHGNAVQLRDADGLVVGYIGTMANINERKRADRRQAANLAVTSILAESPALVDMTPKILEAVCRTLGWEIGGLWTPDLDAKVLRCANVWHDPTAKVSPFISASREMTFARGIGLPGRVWESLRTAWISDVTKDRNFPRAAVALAAGVHAAFGFPIHSGDKFFAVMEFFSRECLEPDGALLEMFASIGGQIGQCMERKRAEEDLRQTKEELATLNASLEARVRARTAELTHANEALREEIAERKRSELARFRLLGIVESSADAILSRTLRGTVTGWNKAAEGLFGYTAEEIIGRSVAAIIPADRREELTRFTEILECGEAIESLETVRLHKDGSRIDVSLTLSPIKDETGIVRAASAIMRDITDRKRAEEALRESEARLQAIMDNSPAMIFLKDTEGHYLHFNRQFAKAFHLRLEEGVGKTDEELFPPHQAEAFRSNDLVVLEAGAPMVFDEVALLDDGPHTSIVTKSPLFDGNGKIYALVGIVTDITERKRLEEEVLHISEREHRRIAQDLHDGLGQQLAGISCLSNILMKNLTDKESPEAATATRISKLLDSAVAQTRGLARGLHPVEPDPTGLMSALEELAASVTELFQVACEFECLQPVRIADNIMATHLYRIAQEAVTNALKHGRAAKIKIGLSATPERTILAIADNGIGIRRGAGKKTGLGLRIMSYRASMIGGSLRVQKQSKCGTEVTCAVENATRPKPSNDDGQTTAKAKPEEENPDRG